ncbi:hypothetical protein M885DRAFT_518855 [Pelagophyceae sp. CCMP2097]|nr:hypothetical protein M885DRAFT_518855 [Pelagophyceae sp. CCMP2097]
MVRLAWILVCCAGISCSSAAKTNKTLSKTIHCHLDEVSATPPCDSFVIISQQRSGSRYFVDKLHTHPLLSVGGELFISNRMNGLPAAQKRNLPKVYRESMAANQQQRCCRNVRHVGFKWMTNQGHERAHGSILKNLKDSKTKVIFLWRRNVLRQLISDSVNRVRGTKCPAHVGNGSAPKGCAALKAKIPGSACDLRRALRSIEVDRGRIAKFYQSVELGTFFYEDLVEQSPLHDETWTRVLKVLGVPAEPHFIFGHSSSIIFHGDKPLFDAVANSGAARKAYATICAAPLEDKEPVDPGDCADLAKPVEKAKPWHFKDECGNHHNRRRADTPPI